MIAGQAPLLVPVPSNRSSAQQAENPTLPTLPHEAAQPQVSKAPSQDLPGWLARELHDGLAQDLLYLGLQLSALEKQVPPDLARLKEQLVLLQQVVQDSYQQVRTTLDLLRSWQDQQKDLAEELRVLAESTQKRTGMSISLRVEGGGDALDLPRWVVHQLKAIIHEALWNAWRHGRARQASVALWLGKRGLLITVTDDGCGFEPGRQLQGHFGLRIMRERAEALGGRLQVYSVPQKGTQVSLYVPREGLNRQVA